MLRTRRASLLVAAAALLLFALACGSSDAVTPHTSLTAGQITCEQLFETSYQYSVKVDIDVGPLPTGQPAATGWGPTPFHFSSSVENGRVENRYRLAATVHNTDGHNRADYDVIQWDQNVAYLKLDPERPWTKEDTSVRPVPYPYWPMTLCDALSPDIDTTKLTGPTSEELQGEKTERYEIASIGNDFFKRESDFGGGSDAAGYTESISGTIWISEKGRYPAKFAITGQGHYPNGQPLTVQVTLEVWDLGGDVNIEQPPLGTPAQ